MREGRNLLRPTARGAAERNAVATGRDPPGEGVKRQECRFPEKAVATGKMPVVPVSRQGGGFPCGGSAGRLAPPRGHAGRVTLPVGVRTIE